MKIIHTTLWGVLLLISTYASAQDVDAQWSSGAQGQQKLTLSNNLYTPIILTLTFRNSSSFSTTVPMPYTTSVSAKGSTSITLSENGFSTPDYNYTYSYRWGCLNTNPDTDYPYLIPVSEGKGTRVGMLTLFNKTYNLREKVPSKNYYAISFSTAMGDTVFASRGGTVFNTKNNANLKHENYSMATDENEIYIAHKDCTRARYSVLNEIFVKEGQKIEAGAPIAIAGGDKYTQGSHVRFCVMYSYLCDTCKNGDSAYGNVYVHPKFYLGNEVVDTVARNTTYTSAHTDEIITKEMSKSELKQWKKKHLAPKK